MEDFPGYEQLRKVRAAGKDQFRCCCPAHDDNSPSLYVKRSRSKWLVHCFAGCTVAEVAESLGLRVADFFLDDGHVPDAPLDPLNNEIVFLYENRINKQDRSGYDRYVQAKLEIAKNALDKTGNDPVRQARNSTNVPSVRD